MLVLNKEIIKILQEITDQSDNFVVKGGSSLLIRNEFLDIDDYRGSTDLDVTTTDFKKGRGPNSQYNPRKFKVREFLISKGIEFKEELVNGRRIIFTFESEGNKIILESSVPTYEEYLDFDIVNDIRIAKLYKVFADKLMILIEYNTIEKDLTGEYLRHLIDIMHMEETYSFSIKNNLENIVKCIEDRIKSNSKKIDKKEIYDNLKENFELLVSSYLKQNTNSFNSINTIINNHPSLHKNLGSLVTQAKVNKLTEVIEYVKV